MPARWSLGYHQSPLELPRRRLRPLGRPRVPPAATSRSTASTSTSATWTATASSRGTTDMFPDPVALTDDLADLERPNGRHRRTRPREGRPRLLRVSVRNGGKTSFATTAQPTAKPTPTARRFTDTVWPGDVHWPDFSKPHARAWWAEQHRRLPRHRRDGLLERHERARHPRRPRLPGRRAVRLRGPRRPDRPPRGRTTSTACSWARPPTTACARSGPTSARSCSRAHASRAAKRYAAAWTGDNVSTWEHLVLSLQICQSLSASGLAYCGTRHRRLRRPRHARALRPLDAGPASSTRFMRTHYSHEENERSRSVWSFGPEVEAVCRDAIRLRYALMPDAVLGPSRHCARDRRAAHEGRSFSSTPATPARTPNCDTQTYLGPSLMAAPVVTEGATSRTVLLSRRRRAAGWTSTTRRRSAAAPQARVEALARAPCRSTSAAGGVAALDPVMQHTDQFEPETLHAPHRPGHGHDAARVRRRASRTRSKPATASTLSRRRVRGRRAASSAAVTRRGTSARSPTAASSGSFRRPASRRPRPTARLAAPLPTPPRRSRRSTRASSQTARGSAFRTRHRRLARASDVGRTPWKAEDGFRSHLGQQITGRR